MSDLISRQAAIDLLDNLIGMVDDNQGNDYDAAFHMAIEALKAQADGDTISRQAAINAVEFGITYAKAINKSTGEVKELFKEGNKALNEAVERIKDLPSAQPEKRTEERTETHACDCIERQAAIDALDKIFPADPMRNDYTQGITCGAALATEYIKQLPSAQPETIRCKDCKYWMPHSQLGFDEDNGTYHDYCERLIPEDEYYAFYRDADDYCSFAERRTDE